MRTYLADVWRYRHFWLSLVRMDLQVRYRRSVLGIGWSLLQPIATALVLCVVFHQIFGASIREYVPFLLAGLAWWAYVTGVIGRGCQCFVEAESYIRQHPVPMAVYPLRTAMGAMIHFLIALAMVLLLTWCVKGFDNLTALPALLAGLVILFVLGWSLAVLAGWINTIFRDVQHLTEICFQILFYLTPVMYPADFLARNNLRWIVQWNPLVHLLAIVRDPLIEGTVPALQVYGVAVACTLSAAGAATLLLGRLQRKVILYL
ncbi:MAG TPA: ABC transporter permease [Gemmataceae bacterium]|nr:ABC transporter permease [Gemmataceae bacterium]